MTVSAATTDAQTVRTREPPGPHAFPHRTPADTTTKHYTPGGIRSKATTRSHGSMPLESRAVTDERWGLVQTRAASPNPARENESLPGGRVLTPLSLQALTRSVAISLKISSPSSKIRRRQAANASDSLVELKRSSSARNGAARGALGSFVCASPGDRRESVAS